MGKINLLDDRLINQIAAGEVVENPASVIKELVENSLDAGSTSVTVEFSKGGTEYIRIADNGCGMDCDDARTAFVRHATSKISSPDDLEHISTMGFRGEALASISEVSHVELTTSTGDVGTKIVIRGGICESVREIGFPRGTTIEVSNLFFNTPARKKFLKSVRQETNNILELCSKFILAHPDVSFRIINNGRVEMRSVASGDALDAVSAVYGTQTKDEVISVAKAFGDIEITGFVCKPAFAQLNRRRQSFFVNGRYVKSAILAAALDEAYKGSLMVNKFPYAVLYIKMPYNEVDVNVHPQKTEVRFSNSKAVYNAVLSAVSGAIAPNDVLPEITFKEKEKSQTDIVRAPDVEIKLSDKFDDIKQDNVAFLPKTEQKAIPKNYTKPSDSNTQNTGSTFSKAENNDSNAHFSKNTDNKSMDMTVGFAYQAFIDDTKIQTKSDKADNTLPDRMVLQEALEKFDMNIPAHARLDTADTSENIQETLFEEETVPQIQFKVCGVLWDTYILVQCDDLCYIIDQHAAHERFLYDKFSEEFNKKKVAIQQLLIPEVVKVEPTVVDIISENIEAFYQLGFDIDVFGNNACVIRGVPSITSNASFRTVFNEALELMKQNLSAENVIRDVVCPELMKSACKHAVKGNQKLSDAELKFIIEAVKSMKNLTCPHGRPIAITMSRKETEKRFGRVQ